MAVPPTSPLRVFPQAVKVDVQGFMPQGDLFQKTMTAFEQGSKLPLLQEQIKTEKMRNKLERDKLKLAEQTLLEDDARARTAADLDAQMKAAELDILKTELTAAQQELKLKKLTVTLGGGQPPAAVTGKTPRAPGGLPGVFSPMFRYGAPPLAEESVTPAAATTPAATTPATTPTATATAPAETPLADQTIPAAQQSVEESPIKLAPLSPEERAMRFGEGLSSEEIAANNVRNAVMSAYNLPPRDDRGRVIPSQTAINRWVTPRVQTVSNLADAQNQIAEEMAYEETGTAPGQKVAAVTAVQFKNARSKALRSLKVETDSIRFFDAERNLPMMAEFPTVGGQFFATRDNPMVAVIDVETLHKNEGLKKRDQEYATTVADLYKNADVTSANLQNLDFAENILQEASAKEAGGKFTATISGPLVSFVPESVRARVPGLAEGVAVQDAILNVVQQSLKATLGGQFAQKEAQELFKRAFDPRQPESENLRRLRILKAQILAAQSTGDFAADYFNANGTLQGFSIDPEKRAAVLDKILKDFKKVVDGGYSAASTQVPISQSREVLDAVGRVNTSMK
jgi:hypothetical protein